MLTDGPTNSSITIVLAHGAGAAMDTAFMNAFAEGLASAGFRVVRFEFPYMAERRRTGKKKPPDREPVLRQNCLDVIDSLDTDSLIIGGKSMGGRIASLIAEEANATGLACLGYPFHPAGKPDKLRIEHLQTITTPTLILQGERDSFGNKGEVAEYSFSNSVRVHWLPDGDHSFKPRKASGRTQEDNWTDGVETMVDFIEKLESEKG